jgi:uroporphyrinogen-III synthase
LSKSADALPLAGRRILITRAPHQASELADRLRALGASPILIATIEIAPPASFAALDSALAALTTYDWLIFTSANAVEAFHRRVHFLRLALLPRQQLPGRIAAIGPATERALNSIGLAVDLLPPRFVAESLAESLLPKAAGKSFLLVRAAAARDTLPNALTAAGAAVTVAEAYRNQIPQCSIAALQTLFSAPAHYPDAILFTSASTATNLAALLESSRLKFPAGILRASIGPITSQALRELGLPPQIEAEESTIPALVTALVAHFNRGEG